MARNLLWETDWYLKLMLLCTCLFSTNAEFDGGWATQIATSNGLCRYGRRVDCCWGWTRLSWGHCQPSYMLTYKVFGIRRRTQAVCHHGCKHGQCAGPNKCKCHPGFTGKTCNQDAHICAMADCQYGCDVVKGEVRCQCPSPGLHLAPDGRTCVDIDECAAGLAVCPRFHRCINTFGGYICKCFEGFTQTFINGKYQCTTIPKVIIEPPRPGKTPHNNGEEIPAPDLPRIPIPNPPVIRGTEKPISTTTTTAVPPPHRRKPNPHKPLFPTRKPQKPSQKTPLVDIKPRLKPQRPPVFTTKPPSITRPPQRPPATPSVPSLDNRISKDFTPKQRGDVHIPRRHGQGNGLGFDFDIELGNTDEQWEMGDDPEVGVLSCSFDHHLCEWIRQREEDTKWVITRHPSGESYLSLPEVTVKHSRRGAQLILPLSVTRNQDFLCLSFRHYLPGHRVGVLQVFEERGKQHSSVVWGRQGGSGWRLAHITLSVNKLERIIIKGERRRDQHGLIALDDITLRRGRCMEERHLRR